jgi:hypothetical protein
MMTFLEFVFRSEMGPPHGQRSWYCPWCDPREKRQWVTMSVMPTLQRDDGSWFAVKATCHNPLCDRFHKPTDASDLIKKLYRGITPESVNERVFLLHKEWEDYIAQRGGESEGDMRIRRAEE